MVPRFRRFLLALMGALVVSAYSSVAQATTVIMVSDRDLIQSSRVILTATVETVFSAWDDSGTTIWTYVEVRPTEILKGVVSTETVVLKQPGGIVGSDGIRFIGQPLFAPGDELLVYLNPGPDGALHIAHSFVGMFSIVTDASSGDRFVQRWSDSNDVVNLDTARARNDVTDRAPVNRYLTLVRDVLSQSPGTSDQSDFVTVPAEYYRKKFDAGSYYYPQFVLFAGGVRWMQADSGQSVIYSLNPDRSPIAGGGTAELSRAMNAWSAQSGANIRLQLGSQTGACGYATDNVNTISYGDCQGVLDPPVNCSGVLAQTRIAFTSETKVVGGRTFRRLTDADVVFNDGFDCFLRTSANLAETACHELGHSIGLDHSSDAAAIMWPSVRGGGRDATLGNDDKAGVLAIYPAVGGTPPVGGVAIGSLSLPHGAVSDAYHQTLSASGGTPPYTWRVSGGQLPSGLSLSSSGSIDGVPTQAGTYQMTIQVTDASRGTDSRAVAIVIDPPRATAPVITSVKVKNNKKLKVFGNNFRADSLLLLNGNQLIPRSFDPSAGELIVKGKLHLGATGTNVLQVVNPDQSSAPFHF